ncbi:MAG: hypothetical protein V7L22_07470 [Nostoc sp.]|uniref:hypothetical protein n=1 Tax=Nostoc sp. TaxID=1180 RepID=UPI002FF30607
MVSTSVGNLSGILISGGNEAILIGGCGIAEYLVGRTCIAAGLREVVVLHIYDKDMFDPSTPFTPFKLFALLYASNAFTLFRHYRVYA